MLEQLEVLWQSWLNRLIVALLVIAFFDYKYRPHIENDDSDANSTQDPVAVSQPDEKRARSRLLDQVVEDAKEATDVTTDTDQPKENGLCESKEGQLEETSNIEPEKEDEPDKHEAKISGDAEVNQSAVAETKKITNTKSDDPPAMKATSNEHPGMGSFNYWLDIECSLFRVYTLGRRDDVDVVPPYVPHSYRGTVPIFLHVTNTTNIPLKVFWIDYKGKSIFKGDLPSGHNWTQTTWIDQ